MAKEFSIDHHDLLIILYTKVKKYASIARFDGLKSHFHVIPTISISVV